MAPALVLPARPRGSQLAPKGAPTASGGADSPLIPQSCCSPATQTYLLAAPCTQCCSLHRLAPLPAPAGKVQQKHRHSVRFEKPARTEIGGLKKRVCPGKPDVWQPYSRGWGLRGTAAALCSDRAGPFTALGSASLAVVLQGVPIRKAAAVRWPSPRGIAIGAPRPP